MGPRSLSLLSLALVGGIAAWTFAGLSIRQDITAFVPFTSERRTTSLAREVIESELSRTMMLSVQAGEPGETRRAAGRLSDELRALEGIEWVERGPSSELEAALYQLYFPRRYAFFADSVGDARAAIEAPALADSARRLREELRGPMGVLIRRIAPDDPLLFFADQLRRLRSGAADLDVVDGQLMSRDGWALILAATRESPFHAPAVRPLLAAIDSRIAALRADFPELRLEQASIHRFAESAERGIRGDVQRISSLSLLGAVLLFGVLYRRPQFLLLGAIPLGVGSVAAFAACRLLFGGIHGITTAFGASLLGVGIDYVAHYLNHYLFGETSRTPYRVMRDVAPSLSMGAVTTIVGLAGLAWTGFPGMQEIALFGAVGVGAALLATMVLIPPWMPADRRPTPVAHWTASMAGRLADSLIRRRRWRLVPLLAFGLAVVGIPQLTWIDDIRALNDSDPALRDEDERVRERFAIGASNRFLVACGENDEQALQRMEAALSREDLALGPTRSLLPLLRSRRLQDSIAATIFDDAGFEERAISALLAEDFVAEAFEPFRESLRARPPPLEWEELARQPAMQSLVRPFRAHLGDSVAYFAFPQEVRDSRMLAEQLSRIEGVTYFDRNEFLVDIYRSFRARTLQLIAAGLLIVFALSALRYRSLRLALGLVVPPLLAAAATLGLLGVLGVEANLMHLIGGLLVLSMGEDYAVFLLESRDSARDLSASCIGIGLAAATTILSFGLLAASSHPALRALGQMVGIGVAGSLLLAPLALVIGGRWNR